LIGSVEGIVSLGIEQKTFANLKFSNEAFFNGAWCVNVAAESVRWMRPGMRARALRVADTRPHVGQ